MAGWLATEASSGQSVKCYGYGFSNNSGTQGLGDLRTATLTVSSTNGLPVTPGGPFYPNRFRLGPNISPRLTNGDSGGPCFDTSTNRIVGIHSSTYEVTVWYMNELTKMSYVWKWVRNTVLGCNPEVQINCP